MELENKSIETWLKDSDAGFALSGSHFKFYSSYETLKLALLPKHLETTKGAILESIQSQIDALKAKLVDGEAEKVQNQQLIFHYEKIRWLNDHGPNHIETVIKRATQLLNCKKVNLTHREIYCLLCAIQLHDLGNFYGRAGHEQKIPEILNSDINKVGTDQIERRHIIQIAEVHGGTVNGTKDKDTISSLKNKVQVLDDSLNLRLIAAVLRFADEIADDKTRADGELLNNGKLPRSSEVYHAYSSCLNSVSVKHENATVELHFYIPKEYLTKKFGKDDSEIYLIDEIHNRVLKMHLERQYCSRFWKELIDIEKILVLITFYTEKIHEEVHKDITFTVQENGYPKSNQTIFELCPDLVINGIKLDGDYFHKQIPSNG